jgi:serpin B
MRPKKLKNMIGSIVLLIMTGIFFPACDGDLPEPGNDVMIRNMSDQQKSLITNSNDFAIDLLKVSFEDQEDGNIFFSPLGMGMSLGMIYNGVGVDERLKIEALLGLEAFDEQDINKTYSQLASVLQANDNLDIVFSNSLWFPNTMTIDEYFRTRLMAYYDAGVIELNYKLNSSIHYVNRWGEQKSLGRITNLINRIPQQQDIFLVNAVDLNTSWNTGSEPVIIEEKFLSEEGMTDISMNYWENISVKMSRQNGFTFLNIPFNENYFELTIIQPDNPEDIPGILDVLSSEQLSGLDIEAIEVNTALSIPEISISKKADMKEALSRLGLQELFTKQVDLSPSFVNSDDLSIDNIQHNAAFVFSKKALRNNPAELSASSEPIVRDQMVVDRPFLFLVREQHTKAILYSGIYLHPE